MRVGVTSELSYAVANRVRGDAMKAREKWNISFMNCQNPFWLYCAERDAAAVDEVDEAVTLWADDETWEKGWLELAMDKQLLEL